MKTFVLACFLASSLFAIQNVTIGVLAFRTKAETLKEWEPTARYLTQKEPEYRFRILPLTYPELNHAVKNSTIDFVVTNSGHYVYLEKKYHISRIATMMRYVEGRWIDRFGGVVFTRASRDEIQTLADLRGKKIAAVDAESLGGYVAQMVELSHHGVDTKNAQLSFTGMPHTTTIKAVLEGRADAGFVRTDVLEKMVQSGALDASELKVLNAQKVPGFPYYLSTKLYPEWPIAQLRHTPKDLCNEVLIALLDTLPHKIPKEKTIGWAAPMEYSDVHNAFKLLRLPPYDKADPFTLSDIYERYREFIWLVGVFMGLILIGVIREIALRRKLMFENRKNELFLTQSSDGIHILNAAGDIVQVSDLFCKMLGYTREEMMGMNVKQWDLMVPLESIQEHIQTINDECQVVRSKHRRKDGTTYDAEIHVSLIALNEKRLVYCKAQDISRQLLEETRTKLATLVYEHSSDAIVITDQYSRIISVNPSFTQMSGYTIEQIQGSSSNVLKSGHHSAEFYRQLWEAIETNGEWSGEIIDRHHDGPIFSKWLTIKSIYDNEGNAYRRIAIFSDITDQKETKYQLWYHANFDTLTTLSNRSMFLYRLEKEIGDLERHRIPLVLIYLDLDNFKEINDTLGHDKGDMLLQEVAKRLLQCVRRNDVVSRLGGDEFTIILPKIESEVIVDTIASKIILELSRPFHIGGESLFISASMGITVGPNDGESAEVLLKNADQAMYAAKNQGRNRFCYFTPSMQEILNQRSLMIYELRSAIEAKEFVVFYQPIVDLFSGDVYKAEALVRWKKADGSMVAPGEFIPLAEETGQIVEIGSFVFQEAIKQVMVWRERLNGEFQISVNKSPVQFRSEPTACCLLTDMMGEAGLSWDSIIVEITEGVLMEKIPLVQQKLLEFEAKGVAVALDDFGTGYSSLSYLKKFDIDYLKIDRIFIQEVTTDKGDQVLCEAIIAMAHKLGIKVIAEGVETKEQMEYLKAIECDYVQGFYISRPIPPEEFERLYKSEFGMAAQTH